MASYSSSSSSSASQSPHPWRYDVFISFRGEDTRRSFSSHLYDALCRKALLTFIDDVELQRGEEIAPSLVQAIQESNVAVVVFSKDYASSTWCLDELVKIIECHQTRGQIVIPVFYEVNPSHIRKQSQDVATAFERHEQNPKNAHKIQYWRDALIMTASLCGFDSKDFRKDRILISEIVEDISKKLVKSTIFNGDQQLVGVDSQFQQIKQGLSIEGQDVCIIGIWGMGGIGKTTIAEFIFKRLSCEFESCCFLKNVREGIKVRDLKKELISQLLCEKEPNVYAFTETRLGRRRALIVLDDVDDSQQLDSLIGDPCWFGSRSVIIITGRDKQVLGRRAGFLYKVEPLKDEEALQLFSWSAFKQNNPKNDYESLSSSIVEYAHGNPLALKVLGSSLSGKTTKEWESALEKLSIVPNKKIQDVLQIGFDGLDRMEKDIFLHVACFFKGDNKDVVMRVFQSDADIIDSTISVLVDKCFVTVSKNTLEMHDLMQEMGKEIVRQESKHPNERSRLWDPKDVFKVLVEDKGAKAVESIMLDVSKIQEIDLNPEVFMKTPNLKFLKFYEPNRSYGCFEEQSKLRLPQGLDYFPNELTYFHWDGYPLESFPSNFRPNHLIVLGLPNSKIKQFQEEVMDENIGYSVASQLSCENFGTILCRFCSLIKIPSYIYGWQLGKVTSLSLVDCENISHLPNSRVGFLEALEVLNLRNCKNLKTFPEVSSSIKSMDLSLTAIKQIPSSSVEHLGKLEKLVMSFCYNLESLPSNFFNVLTSLTKLNLSSCQRLKKLPEIPENMSSLDTFQLGGTDLEIPSSFGNLKGLKFLDIFNCPKITFVPKSVVNLASLESVYLEGLTLHYPVIDHSLLLWLLEDTPSLKFLSLCSLNLTELPEDLSFLSSVISLDLSTNNFERIPATIKQLSNLRRIDLSYCQRLISLPELPSSVIWLKADNCTSLEQIWALKQLVFESEGIEKTFFLWNCLKLDEDECQEVADVRLRYHKPWGLNYADWEFHMHYPGSRIPEWVKYQSMGDSVEVPIPSRWLNHCLLTVAFFACVKSLRKGFHYGDLNIRCDCYFGDNNHVSYPDSTIRELAIGDSLKDHLVVFFHDIFCHSIDGHGYSLGDVALFKFSLNYCGGTMKILKWGVNPVCSQDQDELCQTFEFPTPKSTVKIEETVVADSKVRKRWKKTVKRRKKNGRQLWTYAYRRR
ncbi:hypothetical protein K2173_025400 [Erythroxylum novogranatense]|uniref:ADP-ribosyl cyclase/cyclic ADP-ribose hydrolase n=1 Tax=Erythroxylum novogranatense TaxID=1862640 RepID=A0AAV8UHR6_9ROSI|nr:hypothetical protein K2173_025400 [Erythroxylum novogranatense]